MSEAMRTSHIKNLVDLLYKKLFKKTKIFYLIWCEVLIFVILIKNYK